MLIAERIEVGAPKMHLAIDFDNEPRLAADEIGDKAADGYLAAEWHTELTATKLGPKALLGECGVVAQELSLGGELVPPLNGLTRWTTLMA